VFALLSLWLLTPFATGALLGASPRARRLAARYYWALLALGLCGVGLVIAGAFVLPRPQSLVALAVGGPLSGFSFWVPRADGDDDGGHDPTDDPGPPPPDGDWERIVQEFERHTERYSARPARAPSGGSEPKSPAPALA
jgi:hypothetical protein